MNKLKISDAYTFFNIIIAGVFLSILLYSGIFSSQEKNYLFECKYYQATGEECPSCGLSRGLSESVRLHFTTANQYHSSAVKLFLFFTLQFIIRIILLATKTKSDRKKIIKLDIAFVIFLFTFCFYQIFFDWIRFYIEIL